MNTTTTQPLIIDATLDGECLNRLDHIQIRPGLFDPTEFVDPDQGEVTTVGYLLKDLATNVVTINTATNAPAAVLFVLANALQELTVTDWDPHNGHVTGYHNAHTQHDYLSVEVAAPMTPKQLARFRKTEICVKVREAVYAVNGEALVSSALGVSALDFDDRWNNLKAYTVKDLLAIREALTVPISQLLAAKNEQHPSWCTREHDCYSFTDLVETEDTALHRRTYTSGNGVDLFRIEQVGTNALEVTATWSTLDVEDLPAAAQMLLQIYQDIANVRPQPLRAH